MNETPTATPAYRRPSARTEPEWRQYRKAAAPDVREKMSAVSGRARGFYREPHDGNVLIWWLQGRTSGSNN